MPASPLERLYPNRCYDCLAVIPHDEVLCEKCKAVYEKARTRDRG